MALIRAALRPAFALFLVFHALAHALLPWQEFLAPASRAIDEGPVILLSVVGVGYAIAALAVIGVRPLAALGRAAMVLASAYSLIAIWRMGQGDLWWGVPVDVALLTIALTGAYQVLPGAVPIAGEAGHHIEPARAHRSAH